MTHPYDGTDARILIHHHNYMCDMTHPWHCPTNIVVSSPPSQSWWVAWRVMTPPHGGEVMTHPYDGDDDAVSAPDPAIVTHVSHDLWCDRCLLITKTLENPSHYRYLVWVLDYIPYMGLAVFSSAITRVLVYTAISNFWSSCSQRFKVEVVLNSTNYFLFT